MKNLNINSIGHISGGASTVDNLWPQSNSNPCNVGVNGNVAPHGAAIVVGADCQITSNTNVQVGGTITSNYSNVNVSQVGVGVTIWFN